MKMEVHTSRWFIVIGPSHVYDSTTPIATSSNTAISDFTTEFSSHPVSLGTTLFPSSMTLLGTATARFSKLFLGLRRLCMWTIFKSDDKKEKVLFVNEWLWIHFWWFQRCASWLRTKAIFPVSTLILWIWIWNQNLWYLFRSLYQNCFQIQIHKIKVDTGNMALVRNQEAHLWNHQKWIQSHSFTNRTFSFLSSDLKIVHMQRRRSPKNSLEKRAVAVPRRVIDEGNRVVPRETGWEENSVVKSEIAVFDEVAIGVVLSYTWDGPMTINHREVWTSIFIFLYSTSISIIIYRELYFFYKLNRKTYTWEWGMYIFRVLIQGNSLLLSNRSLINIWLYSGVIQLLSLIFQSW